MPNSICYRSVYSVPKRVFLFSKNDFSSIQHLVNLTGFIMSIFGAFILFFFIFFGEEILFLFGAEYSGYYQLLVLLSLTQFFNVMTGNANTLLIMSDNEGVIKNILLITGFGSMVLSGFFIFTFGVMGAGYSFCIAMISLNIMSVIFVRKKMNINLFSFIFPNKIVSSVKFFYFR